MGNGRARGVANRHFTRFGPGHRDRVSHVLRRVGCVGDKQHGRLAGHGEGFKVTLDLVGRFLVSEWRHHHHGSLRQRNGVTVSGRGLEGIHRHDAARARAVFYQHSLPQRTVELVADDAGRQVRRRARRRGDEYAYRFLRPGGGLRVSPGSGHASQQCGCGEFEEGLTVHGFVSGSFR